MSRIDRGAADGKDRSRQCKSRGALIAFGLLVWVVSWQLANAPLAFAIGVLAEGPAFALTFYLFLAFPMGRIEPPAARWLMAILMFGLLGFFLPWALFTPVIAGAGPLTTCDPCPENALQIATAPDVVRIAGTAETYLALGVTLAVLVVYAVRVRAASRPQRRALLAVAVTSLLFMPSYFAANFTRQFLDPDPETLTTLAWFIVATRVLLPLGFLIALVQADRFAGIALRSLLDRLAARPTPQSWRDAVADALDDPPLQLAYRDPETGRYREPDGAGLEPPPARSGRAWVPIDRGQQPVAAMVIDEALAEDPELVRAAATATVVAIEHGADRTGDRRAARDHPPRRAPRRDRAGARAGRRVDAVSRVGADRRSRRAARADRGRGVLLRARRPAERRQARGTRRLRHDLRRPRRRRAQLHGRRRRRRVRSGRSAARIGLENLAHRLAAVGGTLEIDSRPGNGTRLTGTAFIPRG